MKRIALFFIFSGFVTFLFGQNVTIYLNEGPRGKLHKIENENNYRMAFRVSGLADDNSVKQFVSKCKSYEGVVNIEVKEMNKSGQRNAVIILDSKKDDVYLSSFLKHAGISKVVSQGKEYSPDNLEQLKQERKNTLSQKKPGLKESQK